MFVILVDFEIYEKSAAEFLTAIRTQASDSLSNEDGCLRFDVCLDNASATSIMLYEIYNDASAFDLHLETSHFKSFDQNTKHMVAEKRVRTLTLQQGGGAL